MSGVPRRGKFEYFKYHSGKFQAQFEENFLVLWKIRIQVFKKVLILKSGKIITD